MVRLVILMIYLNRLSYCIILSLTWCL